MTNASGGDRQQSLQAGKDLRPLGAEVRLPGEHQVPSSGQGPPAGERRQGPAAQDHRMGGGQGFEALEVRLEVGQLVPVPANGPVPVYGCDELHDPLSFRCRPQNHAQTHLPSGKLSLRAVPTRVRRRMVPDGEAGAGGSPRHPPLRSVGAGVAGPSHRARGRAVSPLSSPSGPRLAKPTRLPRVGFAGIGSTNEVLPTRYHRYW